MRTRVLNLIGAAAAILSAALLLDHLGYPEAAATIDAAVLKDLETRTGTRSTAEIGDAIASLI